MPLYFAYGANMDAAAMALRCPRSRFIGRAKLMAHRVVVMREGWLTVARDPRACAHGVLWDLAAADVAALDRFEGVGGGLYRKAALPVIATIGLRRALVYVGANSGPGRARTDYLSVVIAAARDRELPREAIQALERLAPSARRSTP